MVKECLVMLNNEVVTVARYGNTDIQFPSIHRDAKTVFVNCEDGKYSIVDKNYKSKSAEKSNRKKSTEKKTTIDKSVEEIKIDTEEMLDTENA